MREKISACITACDEEKHIRRCLESVKWADEIVVVDSFSKDRTPAICREYTPRVYQHPWLGYIGQKNLIKDLAVGPWILFIDADEEVSEELRDDILREFESGAAAHYDGYAFPRIVYYLGRWIRHGEWYPDVKMRLFRKDKGVCGGQEPHDRTSVPGPVRRLRGHLHHYTYEGISQQTATLNDFSSISARSMFTEGRRFRWMDLFFRPPLRFLRAYVLKGGCLSGARGLVIAICTAFGVFLKYAKLLELSLQTQAERTTPVAAGDGRTDGDGGAKGVDTPPPVGAA
jgi:glycosyltransferase involved in cell wall biosynthesis